MVNSRRRSGTGSSSPAKGSPQFFRIINSAVVQNQKLYNDMMIPGKFVRKYGEKLKLSKLAFLKVPSGAVWQVELSNSRGHVWLHNGWKEFMKYYSISYGHFLVFQYNGNSIFHVLIFDKSASEIEYPSGQTNQNWDFQIPETEDVELDDSVEILDDFLTCQGTFEKDEECTQGMHTAQGRLPSQVPDRRKSVNVDHRFRARQRAKGFESKNPFFMSNIEPPLLNVMILRAAEDWSVRKSVSLKDQQKAAESWMGE
ncbi:hypothetical protein HYC85_005423 [Camellia sinensis]|uniref:TF-B3 domain-containing protein n=1 Tax=Camellia sinensis TaxID=4442 RepID=A0A7J7I276_CAMSI|nr:hypothetical protein HYC85_005423 [Camellia sinensis]